MGGTLREEFVAQLDNIVEESTGRERGYEPKEPEEAKPRRRTSRLGREESFARLDELVSEAHAGAPDDWLAKQANVSSESVLLWRKSRQISRRRGRAGQRDRDLWAVDLLGSFKSPIHPVNSPFDGLWEAPEYVLRRPINYRELCRMAYSLNATLGVGPELMAEALGLRERDIELALTVWASHLSKQQGVCGVCKERVDPRYGKFCSIRCAAEET